ncbi:MAG: outer membrane beta-barrel protein [Candidatus Omnitrophota bacterium]
MKGFVRTLSVIVIVLWCAGLMTLQPAYAFKAGDADVEVTGSVSESYDDNITYVKDDPKDDFITNVSVGLKTKLEDRTRSLELSGHVIQQFFKEYDSFNNTSEDFSVNFLNDLSKYAHLSLSDTFTHADEPRSFEDEFGRTTGRYSYLKNKFNAAFSKEVKKQLTLSARYGNEAYKYSRDDLSDSYLNSFGLGGDYAFSSQTIGSLSYDFSQRTFDPGESAYTNTLSTALRQYFTKQLYFDGRTGIEFIDAYNGRNYTKPLLYAALTNEFTETTRGSIAFTKQYYTNSSTQDLFNYWQVSSNVTRQLFPRLALNFSGFIGEGEYASLGITDKLKGVSAGFTYDIKKNVRGNLSYSYSTTSSNRTDREYTKNAVTVGMQMVF